MDIFDKVKGIMGRPALADEELYAAVSRELDSGHLRDGLWTKALAQNNFEENRAKAAYVKMAVSAMRLEREIARKQGEAAEAETMNLALSLYDQQRHQEALPGLYLRIERMGCAVSKACVARLYWFGVVEPTADIATNRANARRYFSWAEQGAGPGERRFIGSSMEDLDWEQALRHYDAAAAGGDAEAKALRTALRKRLEKAGLLKRPLAERLFGE